jgi:DnaJ-class molecular chaperone
MPEVLSIQGDGWTLPLEEHCPDCQGEGSVSVGDGSTRLKKCVTCDGKGMLLTDNGQNILTLVEAHLTTRDVRILGPR